MDLGLKGVHVLVTGANGGIGFETTLLFLAQGAKVTAHFNSSSQVLQPLLDQYSSQVQIVQANLTVEVDVVKLFASAMTSGTLSFGPVQVLVVNHGIYITEDKNLWELSLEQWKTTLDTNLTSSFLTTREYLKRLNDASSETKDAAAIIFIGSTAGKYGEAGHADYAASKSAMMYGLTLTLKNEIVKIAPRGRVNCIAPGWVKTPMAEEAFKNPEIVYKALATTPLKKVAVPRDVATQVVLLSSGAVSGHVTGQVLMIEGGMEGDYLDESMLNWNCHR